MNFTRPPASLQQASLQQASLQQASLQAGPGSDFSAPAATPTCACTAARTARHLADMQEIARVGMRLIHLVEQRAERDAAQPAQPHPEPAPETSPDLIAGNLGLTFSRIARAVCLANALEARLATAEADRARRQQEDTSYRDNSEARRLLNRQKYETRRMVKREITASAQKSDISVLLRDLEEMMDSDEIATALTQHGISAVVLSICKDLGVTPDLTRWSDDEVGMDDLPDDPDWQDPDYANRRPAPPATTPPATARAPP